MRGGELERGEGERRTRVVGQVLVREEEVKRRGREEGKGSRGGVGEGRGR